jgi:hypothetical protein
MNLLTLAAGGTEMGTAYRWILGSTFASLSCAVLARAPEPPDLNIVVAALERLAPRGSFVLVAPATVRLPPADVLAADLARTTLATGERERLLGTTLRPIDASTSRQVGVLTGAPVVDEAELREMLLVGSSTAADGIDGAYSERYGALPTVTIGPYLHAPGLAMIYWSLDRGPVDGVAGVMILRWRRGQWLVDERLELTAS